MEEEERSFFCNCLYFSTNSLARSLTRLAEDAFASTGLAPSYAFVLISINRNPGMTPSGLAKEMHMQPSTITRFLDKLESKGYLTRSYEGKSSKVFPTDKSNGINEQLLDAWKSLNENYRELLGNNMAHLLENNISEAINRVN